MSNPAKEQRRPCPNFRLDQQVVGPAVFLLSDAASFCIGVDLIVDGAFTCW
jgi:hypothetical protein